MHYDTNLPIFDPAAALARLDNDQTLLSALLRMALEDVPKSIHKLETALLNSDASQVKFHAHTIKGVTATVGASALAAVAAQVQHWATEGQLLLIAPQIVILKNGLTQLQAQASQQGY